MQFLPKGREMQFLPEESNENRTNIDESVHGVDVINNIQVLPAARNNEKLSDKVLIIGQENLKFGASETINIW